MSTILEIDFAILTAFAVEAAFMNETMMVTKERNEIIETCLAAVGPVPDVVTIAELVARASGEAAI